jgi:excisionase family DNA binding protein
MIETPARPALLTIEEVCSTLRQSKASVYRKIGAGELPAVRLGDGPSAHLRVPADGFERYLAAHTMEPAR